MSLVGNDLELDEAPPFQQCCRIWREIQEFYTELNERKKMRTTELLQVYAPGIWIIN